MPPPLLIFDTNVLMDVLLARDGDQAVLLVELAEKRRVELVMPEYVLFEFRGTALRWLREQRPRLDKIRETAHEWVRCGGLTDPADGLRQAAKRLEAEFDELTRRVDIVEQRIRFVARVEAHTADLHFRGDVIYLKGLPPDRAVMV